MTDYQEPTTRLGKLAETLYAGYVLARLKLHRFVRGVGLVNDEISEKHMSHCDECDELKGWSHGTFSPAAEEGQYVADAFDLECGHVDDDPGMRLTEGVVLMMQADAPEYVTVLDDDGDEVGV